jgi:hypothetical protein
MWGNLLIICQETFLVKKKTFEAQRKLLIIDNWEGEVLERNRR